MKKEKIAGVIVTYNRKELLLDNLISQEKQTRKLDAIYIIDNASTDNTKSFVLNKTNNNIKYIRLEKNIGCAGAFSLGIEQAFKDNFDWVYVMDDDGKPFNDLTIETLINKVYKLHYNKNNKIIANSLVLVNENELSFKLYETFNYNLLKNKLHDGIFEGQAKLWNGSLISASLYEAIGGPNKEFGFKGEEVDYKNRATKANAIIFTVFDSLYTHPQIKEVSLKYLFKTIYFSIEPDWKYYYIVRNRIYMLLENKQKFRAFMFYKKFTFCVKKTSRNVKESLRICKLAKNDAKNKILGLRENY